MSASFPVVKEKRPKSSRERNKSFVKNVTSRVSGLLPSTITRWFSGQSSSSANGSATLAESTDSSTEDEAIESPIITQPAAKRMRYSSQIKTTHYTTINTKCSSTNTEAIEPFNATQSPSGRNVFRREPNFVSTSLQPNNEESTVPENNVNSYHLHSPSTSNVSLDRKRKSLFDKTQDFESTFERVVARSASTRVIDLSQPYFKAGLMCSPFYTGRTNYGGAAGSYMNQPNIKRRKSTLVRETSNVDHVTISHSARRVMDILENYSSPLREAKRIPQYTGSITSSISLDTARSNKKNQSYKTQELHVPNIASIIRLKQKSRLMDTTNAARQIIASHSSSAEYLTYPTGSTSTLQKDELTTKIKSRLTRINRGRAESNNVPEPVNLPTLSLDIDQDNLPKFSFSTAPAPPSPTSTVTVSAAVEANNSKTTKTKDRMVIPSTDKEILADDNNKSEKTMNKMFKFSSPVKVSIEPSTKATSTFSFGSPERNLDKTHNQIGVIVSPTFGTQSKQSKDVNRKNDTEIECSCNNSELQSKSSECTVCEKKTSNIVKSPMEKRSVSDKWKCADCWVENDSTSNKCICCGGEKPGKSSTQPKANQTPSNSNNSNKWKCADCWVENDSIINKCVSCGGGKPGENSTQPKDNQIQANSNLTNKWKCADCWVENDSISNKCICCGGGKPATATQSENNQIHKNSNVSNKWQCKDCWVQNDSSASKCVCCGGVKVSSNSKEKESNNSITTNKETIDVSEWKCNDCWVKNKNTSNKCIACGGARPGSQKIDNSSISNEPKTITTTTTASLPLQSIVKSQSAMWECPICLVRNENNRSTCVCCEADKPGSKKEPENKFSFKDNPGAVFKFGINPKESTITQSSENQSTVVETPLKESEANNNVLPKASTFNFGIPKTTQENKLNNEDGKKEEPAKVNFTFGIKTPLLTNQSGETAKPAFTLQFKRPEESETNAESIPEKTVDTSKLETPLSILSSAPKISISSNLFAPSPITTQSTNKISIPSGISSNVNESLHTVSKEGLSSVTPSTSLTILPTTNLTTSQIKVSQSTFTFSAAPIKPINLFTAPVSQVCTANSSFASLQPTTVTSNVSLFNKTDDVNTPAIPLFQKSESTPVSLSLFGINNNNNSTTTTIAGQASTSSTPMFRFRNLGDYSTEPQTEKPKFNFTFGSTNKNETSPMFKTTFGTTSESNKFTLPAANTLGTSNTLTGNALGGNVLATGNNSTSNIMPGINGLPSGNTLLGSEITPNQLGTGNALSASGSVSTAPTIGLFGTSIQKMWTPNNAPTGNTPAQLNTINYEKPATFTFGSSTSFNSNTSNTAFGTPQQQTQNVFGITNQNNNNSQPALFSNTIQSPASSNIFGAAAPASNATPAMNLFGATSTFGTPNASMPTFEAPSLTPTPSFNFGSQATSGVFGFSQQQQPQQQTSGVYNFGATSGSAPQVQFNIGSAPNSTTRRVRKAVRRTTQR